MKRNALTIGVVLSLFVSACGAQATATVNPVDVQHTAEAAAFTMVAETQAAIPTDTPLPPTEAPTLTPLPSLTPLASPTLGTGTQISTPIGLTITPQPNIPTFTPQASGSGSGQDPCNQALTDWQGRSANLNIVNETKPKGTVILSLYVVTDLGQCGYLYVSGDSITGPVGQYSAGAFVEGPKNFKVFGGFRITEGSWKIVVRNDSIIALGGCYPSC